MQQTNFKSVLVLVLTSLPFTLAFAPSRAYPCDVGIQSHHYRVSHHHDKIGESTLLKMGLFDFFSEEARQARKQAEEARKREEEEAFREMMERRRNPEKMEEYEAEVAVRRANYKQLKTKLEQQQEEIYIDDDKN